MANWWRMLNGCTRHPKVAGLSDRAFRWWLRLMEHATDTETDGTVLRVVKQGGRDRIQWATGMNRDRTETVFSADNRPFGKRTILTRSVLTELEDAGLVRRTNGVYVLHDWHIVQAPLMRIISQRPREKERKQAERSAQTTEVVRADKPGMSARTHSEMSATRARARPELTPVNSGLDVQAGAAPNGAPARNTQGETMGRSIQPFPEAQQPDEHGIRPYVYDAAKAFRNTGVHDYLQAAHDEPTITDTERDYLHAIRHNRTPLQ